MARRKAAERGLTVEFQVKDAMKLGNWDKRFATVIDSGLFHVLSDEDRVRYVAGLTHVTKPGGRLLLLCFSDEETGTHGPRQVSQREIRAAFDETWTVEEIRARHADVRPDMEGLSFSEGGPKVWFAIIRRNS
jgi:ubiquinone/menaquinone biosynthesis C-methylase UbiE